MTAAEGGFGLVAEALDGDLDPLEDVLDPAPVVAAERVFDGLIWGVRRDEVDLGAETVRRDVLEHPGAVAILALDAGGRLALVQQYRHPIGLRCWEIPAGLVDPGEAPLAAAARELAEEADLRAGRWDVLMDYFTSPGYTTEAIRIYLARDLAEVPEAERHQRSGEERDMPLRWVAIDAAASAVLTGRLHNPHTVVAILTAHARRESGWADLRPADEPWPLWERLRAAQA